MHEINLHIDELLALPRDCWRKMGLMKRTFEQAETHENYYGREQLEVVAGAAVRCSSPELS